MRQLLLLLTTTVALSATDSTIVSLDSTATDAKTLAKPATALQQVPPQEEGDSSARTAAPESTLERRSRAQQHFLRGKVYLDESMPTEAYLEFEEAYKLVLANSRERKGLAFYLAILAQSEKKWVNAGAFAKEALPLLKGESKFQFQKIITRADIATTMDQNFNNTFHYSFRTDDDSQALFTAPVQQSAQPMMPTTTPTAPPTKHHKRKFVIIPGFRVGAGSYGSTMAPGAEIGAVSETGWLHTGEFAAAYGLVGFELGGFYNFTKEWGGDIGKVGAGGQLGFAYAEGGYTYSPSNYGNDYYGEVYNNYDIFFGGVHLRFSLGYKHLFLHYKPSIQFGSGVRYAHIMGIRFDIFGA